MQEQRERGPQLQGGRLQKWGIKRRVNTQNNNSRQATKIEQQTITMEAGKQRSNSLRGQRMVGINHTSSQLWAPLQDDGSEEEISQQLPIDGKAGPRTEKDEQLHRLRSRNSMLKQQIYRLQRLEAEEVNKAKLKREHNIDELYYAFSTKDSLQKELDNAYSRIKRMEEQIQTLRKQESLDEPKKIANLKQRVEQIEKVKNERIAKLETLRKQSKKTEQKISSLRDGGYKEAIRELLKQVQLLQEKQKEMVMLETKSKQRIVRQQEYIRRLQKQLSEGGVSRDFVQEIMNRVMYGVDKNGKEKTLNIQVTRKQSKEQMQKQHKKAEYEIGILVKSIREQEKMQEQITAQEKIMGDKVQQLRVISLQLDQEIAKNEQQIIEIRKTINPLNLKPKPLPPKEPSLEDYRKQNKEHLRQVRKKFQQKKTKKYLKGLQNMEQVTNQFAEGEKKEEEECKERKTQQKLSQQDEQQKEQIEQIKENEQESKNLQIFGKAFDKGAHFSDQGICAQIGEDQCFLTGLTVLMLENRIIGVKAQYSYKYETAMHRHQNSEYSCSIANDKNYPIPKNEQTQQFECVEDEHIVSITGALSQQSILADLTVLTNLNRYHRFGGLDAAGGLQFEISNSANSRPVYLLGCVQAKGICQLGARVMHEHSSEVDEEEAN